MTDLAAVMSRASAAFQSGDYERAHELASQAARAAPANAKIAQFLGIAQVKSGRADAGLQTLRTLLVNDASNAALRLNTAQAALDSGQADLAETLATPLGNHPHALLLRALARKHKGDTHGSVDLLRKAATAAPDDAQVRNNLGNALVDQGRPDEALEHLEAAARLAPSEVQVWLNIGRAHAARSTFEAAIAAFEKARQIGPSDPVVAFELGKSFLRHGQHEKALASLADAARLGNREPQLFVLIGLCFAALEQRDKAEEAYRMALGLDADYTRAFLNLAILLEQENRVDELRALVVEATGRMSGPDLDYCRALVLWRDGDLEAALELAQTADPAELDPVVRSQFIGQVADRLNRVDLAFASYDAMNKAMAPLPEAQRFDGSEHSAYIAARTKAVTPEWYARWSTKNAHDGHTDPIFLGGFLRSGTTLLDTALMGHPRLHVREEEPMLARLEEVAGPVGALPDMRQTDIASMRAAYFNDLTSRGPLPPGKLLVDKYPLMTLRSAYIHRAFPEAKFVFALRHPLDVVLSCWMQNFRITQAMASFLTLENSARFYDTAMTHWEQARQVMPLNVHTVRYEDLTANFEGEMRALVEFLDIEWTPALLDFQSTAQSRGYIRTPSYSQVTEKIYTRASGRWERYRHHLNDIIPILQPWITRFGYD